MQGILSNIKIQGIVSAVPKNKFDNVKYAEETKDRRTKKQVKLTGIKSRRVCQNGQMASDLATVAAEDLLGKIGWRKEEIDVMIFVTQSSDIQRPSTAFLIQERLGLPKECMVFDINQGCAGYVVGLITLSCMLQQTKGKGLLLVGESNAREGDELTGDDLLAGDAASATALQYCDMCTDRIPYLNYCDGSRSHLLYMNHESHEFMDGNAILLFGLSDVANSIDKFMKDNNISDNQVDYYAFHQAQQMIVDGIAREAGLSMSKVLYSADEYGNASSASVPLTLCREKGSIEEKGEVNVLICGYGIGLTLGVMYIPIDLSIVYPIVETDYVYCDRARFEIE